MAATKDKDRGRDSGAKNKKSWFEEAREYYEGSKSEIKKVTWPTKKEVKVTTFAVLGFVAFMAVYLSIVDFAFLNLVDLILVKLVSFAG